MDIPGPSIPIDPMRVAVTGASGMIGSELVHVLETGGHEVHRLVRSPPRSERREIGWQPAAGKIDREALEGMDAVVHLAGENVGQRWTEGAKRRIYGSRTQGTSLLAEALASLRTPPRVLVSASAIGYYGDRGAEFLEENSAPGTDFLARVTRAWEEAAEPASRAGIRVVQLRFGVVLSPQGGALARMLPPFRLGLGGKLGSGRQWMSWVSLPDVVAAIRFAMGTESLHGPCNTTTPEPVTNAEFTHVLGQVLGRPTLVRVPATALRLVFGEMAETTLLASQRVLPSRLLAAGYRFRYPHLEEALRAVLSSASPVS